MGIDQERDVPGGDECKPAAVVAKVLLRGNVDIACVLSLSLTILSFLFFFFRLTAQKIVSNHLLMAFSSTSFLVIFYHVL